MNILNVCTTSKQAGSNTIIVGHFLFLDLKGSQIRTDNNAVISKPPIFLEWFFVGTCQSKLALRDEKVSSSTI